MAESLLPDQFKDLEPYLAWALESERERTEKKATTSIDEIRAFFDAMMPQLDKILDHLDGCFGEEMPVREHRLYLMSLSLVEVATFVELYKRPENIDACDPLRFVRED